VIWIILAFLGVPLWLCVGGIVYLLLLNRRLRKRQGDISVRVRHAPGERWGRGHAIWVGDVFAFRSSPSGWSESLDLIRSARPRELTADDAHHLRHVEDPIVALLSGDDRTIEVASAGSQKDAVLGPFKTERVLGGPDTVGPMDTAPARA
jgi:hypothetical protein